MTKQTYQRVLGFDFGMKRIGAAIGQTITKTASPLCTIKAVQGEPQWELISKLIKTWQPDVLLVGVPLNMDGTEQFITRKAQVFAELLQEKFKLPVLGVDERLTTKDAREKIFAEGGFKALQKGKVDSTAAQLIVQSWLNSLKESE